ncbi:MAG: hypothetical protein Q8O16_07340 [Dehalococcoidia bacterium]|nr:hypothetical protein [Dehalococcoidia bacterium]
MGFFKKKVVKEISGGAWGHLVTVHKIDVDTLSKDIRCVEKEGTTSNGIPVTFLRVFRPKEAQDKGVNIVGWETFDEHPELVLFEGYLARDNNARLERKRA